LEKSHQFHGDLLVNRAMSKSSLIHHTLLSRYADPPTHFPFLCLIFLAPTKRRQILESVLNLMVCHVFLAILGIPLTKTGPK
jgi:hypothetical protein